ncbi:MAG: ATP-binding cassette domain-containing protein [Synergistales bacterium]|nr:ATP-binding cassette domain-containing protein [Synergistales bacterium]
MDPERRASRIGFLFQDAERQIFHSNVADEVLFSLRNEKLSAVEKKHRLEKALRETNLSGMECLHPLDLSSAERRMVAVASLAVKDLDLLLLDEPTRDFDDRWRCVFEEWLSSQRGAVLAVSHDPRFVSSFFSSVWTLKDGHLTE